MGTNNSVSNWTLGDEEIAKICSFGLIPASRTMKVYIPKLMPLIGFGSPKNTTVSLNKSFMCNDSKCKPAVGSSVVSQNYVALSLQDNRNWSASYFNKGDVIHIEVKDKNPDYMVLSTKVDPTFNIF